MGRIRGHGLKKLSAYRRNGNTCENHIPLGKGPQYTPNTGLHMIEENILSPHPTATIIMSPDKGLIMIFLIIIMRNSTSGLQMGNRKRQTLSGHQYKGKP